MRKKVCLLVGLLFFLSSWVSAQDEEIRVKEGNLSFFKTNTEAFVLIDLSEVQYGKENLYEEYRQTVGVELPKKLLDRSISDFCVQFNYQNKEGLRVNSKNQNAPYRMDIQLHQLNEGNAGGILNIDDRTAGGAKISGIVSLIEVLTNKPLCTIEFNDISSDSKLSKKARIAGAFEELGFQLGKLVSQ